jgi:hypothetical protein
MLTTNGHRKESDIQAAEGPPDPELESLIAPQGYDPQMVDDVATLETPAQQRWTAIRFLFMLIALVVIGFWFCTPADLIIPDLPTAPYGVHDRPAVPQDKFLENVIPRNVGNFKRVDLKKEQIFEDPYIGEVAVQATYVDPEGNPVTVVMLEADSYINARRYLENYKKMLHEQANLVEWQERLYIEDNFIEWAAPDFADRAYGLAWNNDRYLIAVTAPISSTYQALAAEFPY